MKLLRFTKLWVGMGLLLAVWALSSARRREPSDWIRPIGMRPGPVRIVQFYASVRILTAGDRAQLCYDVENAKSVRIAPISQEVYPSFKHCLEIVPEHTTHYTILAEGFDGKVAIRSLILPVAAIPDPPRILSDEGRDGASGIAGISVESPAAPTTAKAGRT
jgi:hypothetical protein